MQIEVKKFRNTSPYRQKDPETGTMFEPGVETVAVPTKWLESQTYIIDVEVASTEELAKLAEQKEVEVTATGKPFLTIEKSAATETTNPSAPVIKGKK